jgi:hypothetical protein
MHGLEKIMFFTVLEKSNYGDVKYDIEEHRYEYRDMAYKSPLEDSTRKYVVERYKISVEKLSPVTTFSMELVNLSTTKSRPICLFFFTYQIY